MSKPMTPFSANPFIYIFAIVAIVGVLAFYGWTFLDTAGVGESQAPARVTGKQYNPPSVTYRTNVVNGRAWTQPMPTGESYVVSLNVAGEPTIAIVDKQRYDALRKDETVQVRLRRTRLSGRLEVIEVL